MRILGGLILATATGGLLAACTSDRLIIDDRGVDPVEYEKDLADCEGFASKVNVLGDATAAAVGGAIVGGVIGAAVGDGRTAQQIGGLGAATSGVKGAGRAAACMGVAIRCCFDSRSHGAGLPRCRSRQRIALVLTRFWARSVADALSASRQRSVSRRRTNAKYDRVPETGCLDAGVGAYGSHIFDVVVAVFLVGSGAVAK
jgi:outer membrane lipoprotein SlyB